MLNIHLMKNGSNVTWQWRLVGPWRAGGTVLATMCKVGPSQQDAQHININREINRI